MSSFNEAGMMAKLSTLKHTQESIQGLSMYLLHHRKFSHKIAHTWLKEVRKERKPDRLLNLFYLANDLLQNCRKKWPKYLEDYAAVLPDALGHIARCSDERTIRHIHRTITVWSDRVVYKKPQIDSFTYAVASQLSTSLLDVWKAGGGGDPMAPRSPDNTNFTATPPQEVAKREAALSRKNETPSSAKRRRTSDGAKSTPKKVEDNTPPLNTTQLLDALNVLDQPSVADAETREKLSQYPAEIANPDGLSSIRNEQQALDLLAIIKDAQPAVESYNQRLATEHDHRVHTQRLLLEYHKALASKSEVLDAMKAQCKSLLRQVKTQKEEALAIINQLPDLNALPMTSMSLAPLPSAADLFSPGNKS